MDRGGPWGGREEGEGGKADARFDMWKFRWNPALLFIICWAFMS